jgi:MFS family permease
VWSANSNASMQLAAPDRLRGRIIGLYFYAFNGTGPLGGLLAGWLCAQGGTELAFLVAGIVGLAGTAVAAHRLGGRPPALAIPRLARSRLQRRTA